MRGDMNAGLPFDSGSMPEDISRTLVINYLYLLASSTRPYIGAFHKMTSLFRFLFCFKVNFQGPLITSKLSVHRKSLFSCLLLDTKRTKKESNFYLQLCPLVKIKFVLLCQYGVIIVSPRG